MVSFTYPLANILTYLLTLVLHRGCSMHKPPVCIMLYSHDPSRYLVILVTSEPTLQGGRLKVTGYFKMTRRSSCSINTSSLAGCCLEIVVSYHLPSKNRIIGICIQDVRPMQGCFYDLQTCTCFLPDQLNIPTRTRCLTSHNNHPIICYFWS